MNFTAKSTSLREKNAQGKTNLLESLYIMSMGKSFRTNKDHDMIGFQKDFCKVKSTSVKDGRDLEIEIIISDGGKTTKINGLKTAKKY